MKKSTLIFFAALAAVFLSVPVSNAYYSSPAECEKYCDTTCSSSNSDFSVCFAPGNPYCVASGVQAAGPYRTYEDCHAVEVRPEYASDVIKSCYKDGSYYVYQHSSSDCGQSKCPSNCSSCSSSSVCTTCDSGYYLSSGSCISCPSNATCSGTSVFTCNSGYTKLNGACVKDTPSNTVNSCPSRMKLSDDGCCCINK